jgi:DNA repair photolyase
MGLNAAKGNMYSWVTHTWNIIKGECPHGCTYCYMKRFGKQNPIRFDEKELNTDLGSGNLIFVGSSCDMWAESIPEEWIRKTLEHCGKFDNTYLFQTKNPKNIRRILPEKSRVCVTIETNRWYPEIMKDCPKPEDRVAEIKLIRHPVYITIEPIIDFDLDKILGMIWECDPWQINIGADSGNNNLPEPSKEKLEQLIFALKCYYTIDRKTNLHRLLK